MSLHKAIVVWNQHQWYVTLITELQCTFELFLSIIPTCSSNPTMYLPRLSPLCVPDNALNTITPARIFHFPSFTSIQCAIIPRNDIFIVSADHLSCVTETFPGAAYSDKNKYILRLAKWNGLQLFLLLAPSCVWWTYCGYVPWHHRKLGGLMWWIWAA